RRRRPAPAGHGGGLRRPGDEGQAPGRGRARGRPTHPRHLLPAQHHLHTPLTPPCAREAHPPLAGQLDDVLDAIEAAADMLVLHKVMEPLDSVVEQARLTDRAARLTADGLKNLRGLQQEPLRPYLIHINELENEGDRLYRRARAELYNFN